MKKKHRKTLVAIYVRPTLGNITFDDVEALMLALGAEMDEGAGSRVAFTLRGERIHFHRPHPGKEAKRYQIEDLRVFLGQLEIEP